jgi:hypothetical protein
MFHNRFSAVIEINSGILLERVEQRALQSKERAMTQLLLAAMQKSLPRHLPVLFLWCLAVTTCAAAEGVTLSITLDHARSNFSASACDRFGGGAHLFIDHPFVHFPTIFFSMKFHEGLGSCSAGDSAHTCRGKSLSPSDGASVFIPLDSAGSASISISRRMTLSIEQELNDSIGGSGLASVVPLYSFMYNINWDGRAATGDEWLLVGAGGQKGVPVGKAQELPVSISVEDLINMPQWPQLLSIERGYVTGVAVKLFYLLELEARVSNGSSSGAPADAHSVEHVILSTELHACAHADWRLPWTSRGDSATTRAITPHDSELPAAELQHVEGRDISRAGEEGQWSHYKCSAGKQWFDDAEVGSASSSGMHAESARHINRCPTPKNMYIESVQIVFENCGEQARVPVLCPLRDFGRCVSLIRCTAVILILSD